MIAYEDQRTAVLHSCFEVVETLPESHVSGRSRLTDHDASLVSSTFFKTVCLRVKTTLGVDFHGRKASQKAFSSGSEDMQQTRCLIHDWKAGERGKLRTYSILLVQGDRSIICR